MGLKMKKFCVSAGDKAPDFTLYDNKEKEFKLSDFKGKRVLLSFHPRNLLELVSFLNAPGD